MALLVWQIVLVAFFSLSSVPMSFLLYYCCGWCCFPQLRFVPAAELGVAIDTTDELAAMTVPEVAHAGDINAVITKAANAADVAATPREATHIVGENIDGQHQSHGNLWSRGFSWLPVIEEGHGDIEAQSRTERKSTPASLSAAPTRTGSMASSLIAKPRRDTLASLFGPPPPRRPSRAEAREEQDAQEWVWR